MVGTFATAELKTARNRKSMSVGALAAARLLGLIVALTSIQCATATGEELESVEVRGNVLYRWQIGDADASLVEGACTITQGPNSVQRQTYHS